MASGNLTAVVFGGARVHRPASGAPLGEDRGGGAGAVAPCQPAGVSAHRRRRRADRAGNDRDVRRCRTAAAIQGADYVINLIGILSEDRKGAFDRVHADLPGRIAAAASAAGVKRLVQVSALGVSADSASTYARSKAAGEAKVRAALSRLATILRPSIVFGPEDQFFNRFAAMAGMSPALPLIGGGLTRFQPVYVGDVADAIMAALARPDAPRGKIYELGGAHRNLHLQGADGAAAGGDRR